MAFAESESFVVQQQFPNAVMMIALAAVLVTLVGRKKRGHQVVDVVPFAMFWSRQWDGDLGELLALHAPVLIHSGWWGF